MTEPKVTIADLFTRVPWWLSLLALLVAVVGGHFLARFVLTRGPYERRPRQRRFALVFGLCERLYFFLFVVATGATVAGALAIAWVGLKQASGWQLERAGDDEDKARSLKEERFLSLGAGALTLTLAIVAGIVARGEIGLW